MLYKKMIENLWDDKLELSLQIKIKNMKEEIISIIEIFSDRYRRSSRDYDRRDSSMTRRYSRFFINIIRDRRSRS